MASLEAEQTSPAVQIRPGSFVGYLPLDVFGIAPAAVGDDELLSYDVPAFVYNGATHSRIGISSNGYLVPGGAEPKDSSFVPLLGRTSRPNGVLAPFWTDLDGTGAPGVYVTVLTDGVDDWLVVEWRVNVHGTTSMRTFQAWIGVNGSEDITYAYDPSAMPDDPAGLPFVVGAESLDGTSGASIEGLPTEDLRVTSDISPTVARADAYTTSEDTRLTVDAPGVLANDSDGDGHPLVAAIVSGPAHGDVTVDADGSFSYTPEPDYSGADEFTYRASDGGGGRATATVALTVAAVDDAPTVKVATGGGCGGDHRSGTITLAVADVDDAAGSLTVSGASGNTRLVPNANLSFAGDSGDRSLRVATAAGRTGTSTIAVTVSDGTSSDAVDVTVHAGGDGSNTLTGTPATDMLLGQNGDDRLDARAGNDLLCGGRGDDTLTGGEGADRFGGGSGTDVAGDFRPAEGDTQDGTVP